MDGVLNINKPAGWTSHDVVAKVRGLLKEKQIGHLGTLDPLATGVLPLAVGAATRLIEFASYPKEYVATCLLGKSTDSYDISGKVLEERTTEGLTEEDVRQAVLALRSITEQVPPMVSAVKVGGRKLYEMARKGEVVERKPRPIVIEKVEVLGIQLPRVTFRAICSAGTYVRSLCQTMGEVLKVGGCMESLQRTQVGPFSLKEATDLENLKKLLEEGRLSDILLPASLLAARLPEMVLEGDLLEDLCHGKIVRTSETISGWVRVLNQDRRLCLIGEVLKDELNPRKVFGREGIL